MAPLWQTECWDFVPFSSGVSALSVACPLLVRQCQLGGHFWRARAGECGPAGQESSPSPEERGRRTRSLWLRELTGLPCFPSRPAPASEARPSPVSALLSLFGRDARVSDWMRAALTQCETSVYAFKINSFITSAFKNL